MTLAISRVNQPEILADEILPMIERYGEISKSDVRHLLSEYRQKSYVDDYLNLCEALLLLIDRGTTMAYAYDTDFRFGEDEFLPELLMKFPYFHRYLRAVRDGRSLNPSDVVTPEEYKYQYIRRNRLNMLQKWERVLRSRVSDFDIYLNKRLSTTKVILKDHFYQTDSITRQENGERALLTTLLIVAQNQASGIDLDRLQPRFEAADPRKIINEVLIPVGCDITDDDGIGVLNSNLLFQVTNPEILNHAFSSSFDENIDFSSPPVLPEVESVVPNSVFELLNQTANRSDIQVASSKDEKASHIGSRSLSDITESIKVNTNPRFYVAEIIPQISPEDFPGDLISILQDLIENPRLANSRGDDFWEVGMMFRDHEFISTCAPIFTPSGNQLTELGIELHDQEHTDQIEWIQVQPIFVIFPFVF